MAEDARSRAADKIGRLAAEPLDLVAFWRACTDVIAGVVPHYWTPCWFTLDPASLLVTSHFHEGLDQFPPEMLANEYYGDDVNKMVDVARSAAGVATLHEATGGDPSSSPRWHANMAMGGDQEMIARLRTSRGDVWGMLGLYREPDAPFFDSADKAFVRRVAPALAAGARRALLVGEATDPEAPDGPGLIMLSESWELQSATPGVARWLAELADDGPGHGRLPSSVLSVAARALRSADNPEEPAGIAVARVLSRAGTWVVLHGACLDDGGVRRIAVIVEPAHPARIYPLLMAAYGLTDRERDVARLVLQGGSTAAIAAELFVSAHTVQEHLKNIFEKTGVRSRRELVGKIFFTHYEPRLRDNEHRVLRDEPLRGGPMPPAGTLPGR
jgi:DNA-binding CsgD family transcriptional regulator